jgi:tryptophan synthase alpha chain
MNRINNLFQNKKSDILNIYYTAGYPNLNDTVQILEALQASGVDMVEIGIPYSDPVADGETIQNSGQKALDNGMTLHILLDQLIHIRKNGITIPILLMGYINPIIQYGEEAFLQKCQQIGIDGLIIPDMPIEVYQSIYKTFFEKYGILNTFLITPQTTETRVRQIDKITSGFIYVVSQAGTTGVKSEISNTQEDYFLKINNLNLNNPKLIGFGISNKTTFQKANQFAQGAIIGSAFVNLLSISKNFIQDIPTFIKSIR